MQINENPTTTFDEALAKLGIADFKERIMLSHSHGELYFLSDYLALAQAIDDPVNFRRFFLAVVDHAEKTWERPDSVFQHILKIFNEARSA